MDDPLSCWIIISICILGHFFFSASETALASSNRFKMQIKADEGSRSAKLVLKTCEKFDRALTMVLVGNNIVAIAVSSIATIFFVKYFDMFSLQINSFSVLWLKHTVNLKSVFLTTFPSTIPFFFPFVFDLSFHDMKA